MEFASQHLLPFVFPLGMFPLGTAGEVFAALFGVTAAVLLVGGWVALRWQRDRHQFTLAQRALERGVNAFPGGPPFWLVSLRQGLMVLTLGVGLIVVGWLAVAMAGNPEPPPAAFMPAQPPRPVEPLDEPGPPPRDFPRDARPEPRPDRRPAGEPGRLGDPGRPGDPGRRGQKGTGQPGMPLPNPVIERWHRTQDQRAVGLIAVGSGIILILLGVVRTAFAAVERKYSDPDDSPPRDSLAGG